MAMKLTHEYLADILNYDRETGIFKWKKKIGRRAIVGENAGCCFNRYVFIGINSKTYPAHRLAWFIVHGVWPTSFIDHVNGNPSDNRIANLRDVSCQLNLQNQRNAQKRSKSGFLGVSFHKAKKRWRAQIAVDNKSIHIGYFDTPESAHEAYVIKKREIHATCSI